MAGRRSLAAALPSSEDGAIIFKNYAKLPAPRVNRGSPRCAETILSGKTTIDADPAKNTWGGLAFTPPVAKGFAAYSNQGYSTEVAWDASLLGLQSGHAYRI